MSVAKNTIYLTFASVIQRILAFVFFTLVARSLGVEMTGRYSFALSFALLFSIVADFGLTSVAVREASRAREKISEIFDTVLGIKLFLGLITFGVSYLIINLMGYPAEARFFVYLATIVIILDSVHLTLYGALRSLFNLKFEAIGLMTSQIVSLTLAALILAFKLNPAYLFGAMGVASIFNIMLASFVLRIKYGIALFPRISGSVVAYLSKIAVQFALAGVFAKVYSYIDMVLISYLKGEAAAGWYSIPVKLTFSFQFIPMAMVAAVYPAMSYYFSCSYDRLKQTFEKSLFYLAAISLPLSFGTIVLANKIIIALYGSDYTPSIIPLQIMTVSLFFAFLDFPVGAVLNACNRQYLQTTCLGVTMIVNVVLNLILIPAYSMIGAAVAAVATYLFLFLVGMIFVRKIVKYQIGHLLVSFVKIFAASLVMAFVVNFLEAVVHWIILIPLGILIYALVLYFIKGITADEIKYLLRLFRNKPAETI